ncbi:hypothetical protein [Neobacillus sp. PS3-40]|uniref:hypothetical protein n=1 Tax=Neobacillus sp. PS3-40 TaxID=3070679 RepID=UPI0027E108FA|nr:hypothetical protein [Neobacillus sp. PS3-40]WML45396.1 hypothetical protein RCG20_05700 [Neobacillus sp. PS3-40]
MEEIVMKIIKWEDIEEKYGDVISGTPKELQKYFRKKVVPYKMLSNDIFKDMIFYAELDHKIKVFILKKNIEPIKELVEFYEQKNTSLSKNKNAILDSKLAKSWGIPLTTFIKEIEENDKWGNLVIDKSISPTSGRTVYYFDLNKVKAQNVNSLRFLSERKELPTYEILKRLCQKDLIKQPQKYEGSLLWDYKYLLDQIPDARNKNFEYSTRKKIGETYEELLNKEINELIEEYLSERKDGTPLIDPWFGNKYGKIIDLSKHRDELQRTIYKIICQRSKIKDYEKIGSKNTYRILNKEESIKFDNTRQGFNIYGIDKYDIDAIRKGITSSYSWHITANFFIKPFILFLLKNMEEEIDETVLNQILEFNNVKKRIKRVVEKLTPQKADPESIRVKVYLTKDENIQVYKFLEKRNVSFAIAWLLGSLGGIRPEEMIKIRIEYFTNPITGESWIDENGLLKPDPAIKPFYKQDGTIDENFGYVRLFMPAKASKQGRSPSNEYFGTLIPPVLVFQINKYLREKIYSVCEERGKGYLFRRVKQDPESSLKVSMKFLYELRGNMLFLPPTKRQWLILKDSRRSMNNWIVNGLIKDTRINQMKLIRAAQVQMRHKERGMIGATNEIKYTESLSDEEYIKVISETLEYPFDREELIKWEIEKGYRNTDEIPQEFENKIFTKNLYSDEFAENKQVTSLKPSKDILKLNKIYDLLENRFQKLNSLLLLTNRKQKDKLILLGYTLNDVVAEMGELEKKLKAVKDELNNLKKGIPS